METIYFLFGGTASKFYFDNVCDMTSNELAASISEMDFSLYVYDTDSHPSELLVEYDGWDGFTEIDEGLYELLLNTLLTSTLKSIS
jgi:hypothetical protein